VRDAAFDRLASEGFVFDQALIEQPDLQSLYRSLWQGVHSACENDAPTLAQLATAHGLQTTLITDETLVAEHPLASDFDECVRFDPGDASEVAEAIEQTQMAQLFAEAIDWLERQSTDSEETPSLLWLHSQGMAGLWDAPLELRNRLVDGDDPLPPSGVEVPNERLADDFDPDLVLGAVHSYSGQVQLADLCLGALLDYLHESGRDRDTLLLLVGTRGLSLGEHGRLGQVDDPLYEEVVHVPLMIKLPGDGDCQSRSSALVTLRDLPATVAAWLDLSDKPHGINLLPIIEGEQFAGRDRVLMTSLSGELALRTPAWHVRLGDEQEPQLYVKPDDRWEANEIASRCGDIASDLTTAARAQVEALRAGDFEHLPELEAELVEGLGS